MQYIIDKFEDSHMGKYNVRNKYINYRMSNPSDTFL